MNLARDLCLGVLVGWSLSLLLLMLSSMLHGDDKEAASIQLVKQLEAAVGQENNGCHECRDTPTVFRCQLFFECALQLTKGGDSSRVASQLHAKGLFIFDRVDLCGASLLGGGVFNFPFAPAQPDGCIPAFAANITWFEQYALQAMRTVVDWTEHEEKEASAKSTSATDTPVEQTTSETTPSSADDNKPRGSARSVAGELSIRVPLVTRADGSLSASNIANGDADGLVVPAACKSHICNVCIDMPISN